MVSNKADPTPVECSRVDLYISEKNPGGKGISLSLSFSLFGILTKACNNISFHPQKKVSVCEKKNVSFLPAASTYMLWCSYDRRESNVLMY